VVPYYLFTEWIGGGGDQWILGGGLREGFIGGFGIGNVDIPIFMGGEWSRGSAPPCGARGPVGPFLDTPLSSRCQ
jgi:hypothetical protein